MNHIVMFSGGIGSYCAAKRIAEREGTKNLYLLFTDTKSEDSDLYRFINEAANKIGGHFINLEDGRDIWQVFKDVRLMGNSRIDPCSRILKRELADKWMKDNFTPENCICYTGIDWTEEHRHHRMAARKLPWVYKAPMMERPLLSKPEMLSILAEDNIKIPSLYKMGFPHNNCGGFCIKTGQAQFKMLYDKMPERYMELEGKEQEVYQHIGKECPFIRVTVDGELNYLSMRDFRKKYLMQKCTSQIDLFDYGGCGCFLDDFE